MHLKTNGETVARFVLILRAEMEGVLKHSERQLYDSTQFIQND